MRKSIACSVLSASVLAAAGLLALPASAQTSQPKAPPRIVVPHSDSAFARELYRLNQPDLIKAAEAQNKGTRSEPLWHAAAIAANWDEIAKNPADRNKATQEYLASVEAYITSPGVAVDGAWALENAKFIFAFLSKRIIDHMEYFANSEKDRNSLAPMALTADHLLKTALDGLTADMDFLGSNAARTRYGSEEAYNAAYMKAWGATVEVEYYSAWAKYFNAMAIDPDKKPDPDQKPDPAKKPRNELLDEAAKTLAKWADEDTDNGVNSQALLLRGKALSESGKIEKALADFKNAQDFPKAPEWVKDQARYQTIVANLNARDFKTARAAFGVFRDALKDNKDALVSVDMLGYRIAWTEALAMKDGKEKNDARLAALKILSDIIVRDPRKEVRATVYDQLATQIPDNADLKTLMPMQQLAVAYGKSTGQKGDTDESKKSLNAAVAAALAVLANKDSTPAEQLDATFLAGVCNAVLDNLMEAAKYNVEFASRAPTDPRAKELLELALQQIGQLVKIAGKDGISPDLRALKDQALAVATGKFKDPRWRYAQAVSAEDSGNLLEAAKGYELVGNDPKDTNYLDAKYRLVRVSLQRLNQLAAKAPEAEIKAAARSLIVACDDYVKLLDAPETGTPNPALERARAYRNDILIIEIAAALNPALKDSATALRRINELEAMRDRLPDTITGALLRYKIQAYQQDGKSDKAIEAVKEYAKSQGRGASATIAQFVNELIAEINLIEKTDHDAAMKKASYAVDLLSELIKSAREDATLKDSIYAFRQLQADMMVRAHRSREAIPLSLELQKEQPKDLFNFMTEARAYFVAAEESGKIEDYQKAQGYFKKILEKLDPSAESYWECFLHIIASKKKIDGKAGDADIRKTLTDLKAAMGSQVGGKKYKEEFNELMREYNVH